MSLNHDWGLEMESQTNNSSSIMTGCDLYLWTP